MEDVDDNQIVVITTPPEEKYSGSGVGSLLTQCGTPSYAALSQLLQPSQTTDKKNNKQRVFIDDTTTEKRDVQCSFSCNICKREIRDGIDAFCTWPKCNHFMHIRCLLRTFSKQHISLKKHDVSQPHCYTCLSKAKKQNPTEQKENVNGSSAFSHTWSGNTDNKEQTTIVDKGAKISSATKTWFEQKMMTLAYPSVHRQTTPKTTEEVMSFNNAKIDFSFNPLSFSVSELLRKKMPLHVIKNTHGFTMDDIATNYNADEMVEYGQTAQDLYRVYKESLNLRHFIDMELSADHMVDYPNIFPMHILAKCGLTFEKFVNCWKGNIDDLIKLKLPAKTLKELCASALTIHMAGLETTDQFLALNLSQKDWIDLGIYNIKNFSINTSIQRQHLEATGKWDTDVLDKLYKRQRRLRPINNNHLKNKLDLEK